MLARFDRLSKQQDRTEGTTTLYRLLLVMLSILFILWRGYRALYDPVWVAALPPLLAELLNLVDFAWGVTLGVLWALLLWRRSRGARQSAQVLDVAELYALSPGEFEQYVGRLFRRKGYKVRLRGGSGDLGVDLEVAKPDGRRAIVQCKRYQNTVGSEVVRELYGTLIHERAHHAFLVTTAEISEAAREWAANKPMTLIDGETLVTIAAALHAKTPQR